MKITRVSTFTGRKRTKEIDVTQAQIDAWANGALIQNAMPLLSDADREFIKTGTTPEEWDAIFGDN